MKFFVGTGSATYAAKANRVLNNLGIENRMVRRTAAVDEGCGWGVEIKDGDPEKTVRLLTDSGVRITGTRSDIT